VLDDPAHPGDPARRGKMEAVTDCFPCSITVAVCTLNRPSLAATLGTLARQSLDKTRYRILVVDNSLDPDTTQIDGVETGGVRIDRVTSAPRSLSIARNTAIEFCATALLAFIDDDACADPDWLASLIECFDNGSDEVATWGGPVLPVFETDRPEWLDDNLARYLSIIDYGHRVKTITGRQYLVGTNIAYRTSVLRQAGGFRASLGRHHGTLLSNEEIETRDRINALGHVFAYSPRPLVYHHIPAARLTPWWFLQRAFWQGVSDGISADLAAAEKYGTPDSVAVQARCDAEIGRLGRNVHQAGLLPSCIEQILESGRACVELYYAEQVRTQPSSIR